MFIHANSQLTPWYMVFLSRCY